MSPLILWLVHFCHCHAIDWLCLPACFCSDECSIPPVLLQCVWTVFMPSSEPPLTLQTRPDPIRHPLHPTPKPHWAPLVLILVSSLSLSVFWFPVCFVMSSTSLCFLFFFLSLSLCVQVLCSFEELKASSHFTMSFSVGRQAIKLAFSLMDIVTHQTHSKSGFKKKQQAKKNKHYFPSFVLYLAAVFREGNVWRTLAPALLWIVLLLYLERPTVRQC